MRPALPSGPWLVVGLGRSGVSAGRLLAGNGQEVLGVDVAAELLNDPGFPVKLGTDGLADLRHARALVKSPGVPPTAPAIAEARARGIPVMGELELGWRLMPESTFVAVSGTNGKSTTTAWLTHILQKADAAAVAAGNIGIPVTALIEDPPPVVVCEASSFQLFDTIEFAANVAILLNLGVDHIEWHGSLDAYHSAKLDGLFSRQSSGAAAIAPAGIELPGPARRIVIDADPRSALPGRHNQMNAGAAAAGARELGVDEASIAAGLETFPGLEHRLEPVATHGGVTWVNDSKATNVEATLAALEATSGPVRLILGGDDSKGQDFTALSGRAAGTYLIGDAADRLETEVGGERCGDLEHAVARAATVAREGDTVLLSPACPSYDQYTNFEERGRHFIALVRDAFGPRIPRNRSL